MAERRYNGETWATVRARMATTILNSHRGAGRPAEKPEKTVERIIDALASYGVVVLCAACDEAIPALEVEDRHDTPDGRVHADCCAACEEEAAS